MSQSFQTVISEGHLLKSKEQVRMKGSEVQCGLQGHGDPKAICGVKTLNEIAQGYGVHPVQVHMEKRNSSSRHQRCSSRSPALPASWPIRKPAIRTPEHKVFSYLLRSIQVSRPNQVWSADITYCRRPRGFMYLVTIVDRVFTKGPCLAIVEHHGQCILCFLPAGDIRQIWNTGNLHYGSGLAGIFPVLQR